MFLTPGKDGACNTCTRSINSGSSGCLIKVALFSSCLLHSKHCLLPFLSPLSSYLSRCFKMYWCQLGTGGRTKKEQIEWRLVREGEEERKMGKQRIKWQLAGLECRGIAEVYNNMKTTSSSRSHSYLHIHWNTTHTEVVHRLYMFISQSLVFCCPNSLWLFSIFRHF